MVQQQASAVMQREQARGAAASSASGGSSSNDHQQLSSAGRVFDGNDDALHKDAVKKTFSRDQTIQQSSRRSYARQAPQQLSDTITEVGQRNSSRLLCSHDLDPVSTQDCISRLQTGFV